MKSNNHKLGHIHGDLVTLREVSVADAEFILGLRLSEKAKLLHKTENDVTKQQDYIRQYLTLDNEWYFIICDKQGDSLGCISIYDLDNRGGGRTGRWIMRDLQDHRIALESKLLVMDYLFNEIGLTVAYTDTHVENLGMQGAFKMWGYEFIEQKGDEFYYRLTREKYEQVRRDIVALIRGGQQSHVGCDAGRMKDLRTTLERVERALAEELPDIDFAVSDTMADDGLLDSLAMTRIITALSMEFGIVIPYEEIRREHFNSPRAMAELVVRLLGK